MSDIKTLDISSIGTTNSFQWHREEPSAVLRFVERDGKRILQQKWFVSTLTSHESEWRDIPLESEVTP